MDKHLDTKNLTLVPNTLADVLLQIERMDAATRAQLSADWLAQIRSPTVTQWTLGFRLVHRATNAIVGMCGFKGPPEANSTVEIAYGVDLAHQGRGYATEAAEALVAYALRSGQVRLVRAHTLAEANASTRVLTKCGFRNIGEVIDPEDGLVWRWEKSI